MIFYKCQKICFWIIFTDHSQIVNKPKHISRSLIDYVCIKQTLTIEFSIITITENIYFSNHDAIRTLIENNNVDFHTVP